jgi:hypothetical protein
MYTFVFVLFVLAQVLYLAGMAVTYWFLAQPVDLIEPDPPLPTHHIPPIVLFYPVLRELEETMRTTFSGMAAADYPRERLRVIAIPNHDDAVTIASLHRLRSEFNFLEVMPVPPTTDPSWRKVWSSWDLNAKAYWWHSGKRAGETALPAKKTRQLIWAMYQLAPECPDGLLSYIDADSVIPTDYFRTAAAGMQRYDVVQNTNITGNLTTTWATSFFAADHISWDATLYKHMTAGGRHPFYVLGKGLFYRFSDLLEAGGFNPWLTIEDPEIGMRLWTNGARLGVVESPLIEEVPATFGRGVTQRKRWVAGFFQSLGAPLSQMGMPLSKRLRARLNFVPNLSLLLNPLGFATGVWALLEAVTTPGGFLPWPLVGLCALNIVAMLSLLGYGMGRAYRLSQPVLPSKGARVVYLLRINPVFLFCYWLYWTVPLVIGLGMFLRDAGLTWERTEKIDANAHLIETRLQSPAAGNSGRPEAATPPVVPAPGEAEMTRPIPTLPARDRPSRDADDTRRGSDPSVEATTRLADREPDSGSSGRDEAAAEVTNWIVPGWAWWFRGQDETPPGGPRR